MGYNNIILIAFLIVGDLIVIGLIWFVLNRYFIKRLNIEKQNQADSIILNAKEMAKSIELDSKDKALNILKDAEDEITKRRNEISREEERLHKRRTDFRFSNRKIGTKRISH